MAIKIVRYRVNKVPVENPSPPPPQLIKYVVFDRQAMKEVSAFFEHEADATKECARLNALTPSNP